MRRNFRIALDVRLLLPVPDEAARGWMVFKLDIGTAGIFVRRRPMKSASRAFLALLLLVNAGATGVRGAEVVWGADPKTAAIESAAKQP